MLVFPKEKKFPLWDYIGYASIPKREKIVIKPFLELE